MSTAPPRGLYPTRLLTRMPQPIDWRRRIHLWIQLLRNIIQQVVVVGMDKSDVDRAALAREAEDLHRELGHWYYDWRMHGGDWHHFLHLEKDE